MTLVVVCGIISKSHGLAHTCDWFGPVSQPRFEMWLYT